MTVNEIKNYFNEVYHVRKTTMRSIKDMIEIANEKGYDIQKIATDNYIVREKHAVTDFRKPLIIDRNAHHPYNPIYTFGGTNLIHFVQENVLNCGYGADIYMWIYLSNKKDGEYIDFEELKRCEKEPRSEEDYAQGFDLLKLYGYLEETDTHLIFHLDQADHEIWPHIHVFRQFQPRLAPIVK